MKKNQMQLYFNKERIHKITRYNDTSFFVRYNQGYGFEITKRSETNPWYWVYKNESDNQRKPLCDIDLIEILEFMNKMKFELIIEDTKSKEFCFYPEGRSFPVASLKPESVIIDENVSISPINKELDKLRNIIADLQDENLNLMKNKNRLTRIEEQKVIRDVLK